MVIILKKMNRYVNTEEVDSKRQIVSWEVVVIERSGGGMADDHDKQSSYIYQMKLVQKSSHKFCTAYINPSNSIKNESPVLPSRYMDVILILSPRPSLFCPFSCQLLFPKTVPSWMLENFSPYH